MHIFTILSTLPLTLALALVPRQDSYPTANNTCFSPTQGTCIGRQIPAASAYGAIIKACAQVPSCMPGGSKVDAVKGRVAGYTATIDLGTQCGGVSVQEWEGNNGYVAYEFIFGISLKVYRRRSGRAFCRTLRLNTAVMLPFYHLFSLSVSLTR
jgi:hypothetical protein